MTEATRKQIDYARSLGISNPQNYTKEALTKLIKEQVEGPQSNTPKPKFNNEKPGAETSQHSIVIQRTEKPHSYEFGKANNRHKIYYAEVSELRAKIAELKEAGFLDEGDEYGKIKQEDKGTF